MRRKIRPNEFSLALTRIILASFAAAALLLTAIILSSGMSWASRIDRLVLDNIPPAKATLVSPSGTISTPTPTYTWNAVPAASYYCLWVNDLSAQGKIRNWYTASEAGCSSGNGTCSITPGVVIAAGAAQWWIQTWNDADFGPWSDGMSFSVSAGGLPGKAILISPSGLISTTTPAYTWNAVSNASWYQLWVQDSVSSPIIQKWFTSEEASCPSGSGICSVMPSISLAQGAAQWWIQTWNASGSGPWSDGMTFAVPGGSVPGAATLISPSGRSSANQPTYIWHAVPNASWYYLWINNPANTPKFQQWYTAAQVGCISGTGTCFVTPSVALAPGDSKWWIQTWNSAGYGPWSDGMSFSVTQRAARIALSPKGATISGVGARQQFTVEAWDAGGSLIPGSGVNATWMSLNPNIATINPLNGAAVAVGSGQVTIRVDVDGIAAYAVLTVTTPGLPRVNLWAQLSPRIDSHIECLWGTSANDVFATTFGWSVLHYDGITWSEVFRDMHFQNLGIWGSSASDVYVVGFAGNVLHFDGNIWSLMTSGWSNMLSAVWGASPRDIFAVSWDGTIVHFDGAHWNTMSSPIPGSSLYGVWGTAANNVYAVGGQYAFHYDGTSWSDMSNGMTGVIENVWGTSGSDIYGAFLGGVFHYNGTRWTQIVFNAPISIQAIWGSSNTDIYFPGVDASGRYAAILHYDGTYWTLMQSPIPQTLAGIWGAPTGEVFASGGGGTFLRGYRGGSVAVTPYSANISGNNNQLQLTASAWAGGSPVAGVTYLWSSSDQAVATVDEDGLVTGLANGTVSITATAFGGAAATAAVTVSMTQRPPVAIIASPSQDTTITVGESVNFLGTASDVDGTIASHSWDFGDGTTASVEDPGPHTYTSTGIFRVTYRVKDDDGAASSAATVVITVVSNQSPTAAITSPANHASFAPGATISFTGSGTDHEDGTLEGSALVWTSSRDGQIGTGTSFTRNDLSIGTHTITLAATDHYGWTGTATVTITVSTVAPIVPGSWHGSTTGMALDFIVNPSADGITQLKYTFSGLRCGGVTLASGSIIVSRSTPWPISERQFLITPSSDPRIEIAGTFGADGATVSGTWHWLTCSGTWTGTPSTQQAIKPQIPK